MLKVFLVWLAVLAFSFLMSLADASREPRGKSMWIGVFMWTLILGGSQC